MTLALISRRSPVSTMRSILAGGPIDFLARVREMSEIQHVAFTQAVRAGVKMVLGTDAGVCRVPARSISP